MHASVQQQSDEFIKCTGCSALNILHHQDVIIILTFEKIFWVWYCKESLCLGVDALTLTSKRRLLQQPLHTPPLKSVLADVLNLCLEGLEKDSFPFLQMPAIESIFFLSRLFLKNKISKAFE